LNTKNIVGEKFGELIVIAQERQRLSCQCSCGNIINVVRSYITSGEKTHCGCKKKLRLDLAKRRFGKLVVQRVIGTTERKSLIWECLCDCGNITSSISTTLQGGKKTSCGCRSHALDLVGKTFGRVKVLERVQNDKNGFSRWKCLCECGTIFTPTGVCLVKGDTKACGCRGGSPLNLLEQQFGRLLVLERTNEVDSGGTVKWLCKCSCGNVVKVAGTSLKKGLTQSCGCFNRDLLKEPAVQRKFKTPSVLLSSFKQKARSRGFEWNLTDEEALGLSKRECFYCGISTSEKYINGIDRIDSSKGYFMENVVSCCTLCNKAKSTLNQLKFFDHIIKLYDQNNFTQKIEIYPKSLLKAPDKRTSEYSLFGQLLYLYKRSARHRNLVFGLSNDEFYWLLNQNCFYCGNGHLRAKSSYGGIDRVDTKVGYVLSNCVPCCNTCNLMKLNQSLESFTKWIIQVYNNLNLNLLR